MMILFWVNPIVPIARTIISAPKICIELGTGIICGAAQAVGIELFTKNSLDEALALKQASDACLNDLPIKSPGSEKIVEIMEKSSRDSVRRATTILQKSGVDEKCVAIFGLVCDKAQQLGALNIIKQACLNL